MFNREPALIIGLVEAGIALLVAFGLDLTGEQVAAILGFVGMAGAVLTRSQVYSDHSVRQLELDSFTLGRETRGVGDGPL